MEPEGITINLTATITKNQEENPEPVITIDQAESEKIRNFILGDIVDKEANSGGKPKKRRHSTKKKRGGKRTTRKSKTSRR
jgi:low affinity Fe/Cu permease